MVLLPSWLRPTPSWGHHTGECSARTCCLLLHQLTTPNILASVLYKGRKWRCVIRLYSCQWYKHLPASVADSLPRFNHQKEYQPRFGAWQECMLKLAIQVVKKRNWTGHFLVCSFLQSRNTKPQHYEILKCCISLTSAVLSLLGWLQR